MEVYVGMVEKTEATSAELIWTALKVCDDDVTDDEEEERPQAGGGGAAMLTKPVNRLRRGSAHRLPAPELLEMEADGSRVKRPL